MVRKQVLILQSQDVALRRLAARSGKSEGALVREALDRLLQSETQQEAAWEALLDRWEREPIPEELRFSWRREEAYEARICRVERSSG